MAIIQAYSIMSIYNLMPNHIVNDPCSMPCYVMLYIFHLMNNTIIEFNTHIEIFVLKFENEL